MTRLRDTVYPQIAMHAALPAAVLVLTLLFTWGWHTWLTHGSDMLFTLQQAGLSWCL